MRGITLILLAGGSVMLSGCLAKTVVDVATAPVKIVSKGVDLATTSQSEADEKRGRELRKAEERLGKLRRDYDRELKKCDAGDAQSCEKARAIYAEIEALLPTVPTVPAN